MVKRIGPYGFSCSGGCCAGNGWMTHEGFVPCPSGDDVPNHHAVVGAGCDTVKGCGGYMSTHTSRARVGRISTSGIHGVHEGCIPAADCGPQGPTYYGPSSYGDSGCSCGDGCGDSGCGAYNGWTSRVCGGSNGWTSRDCGTYDNYRGSGTTYLKWRGGCADGYTGTAC